VNVNVRPSRVPSPTPQHVVTQAIEDSSFDEVERPNNLPSRAVNRPTLAQIPDRQEPEQAALPVTSFGNLAGAIAAIMAEITPVEKSGWNKFQSYSYARIQDLMGTLTPLMGKHGIVVFQNEEGREMFDDGKAIAVRYRFTIVHKSGEIWPERILQTGLSSCRNTKDGFDDKSLNKCHTAARKYFLLSLFQIPTEDAEDGDNTSPVRVNGGNQQRPQGRRPVPSPSGKIAPHTIPIIDGETPQAWASRFGAFIAKTESAAEIDEWYAANTNAFDKLKGRFDDVYNAAIDYMDARVAQLGGNTKTDPISSGKTASDFPGDKTAKTTAHPETKSDQIPIALDRKLTEGDRDWLISLNEAFQQCKTIEEIGSEQDSLMMPSQGNVQPHAWNRACDMLDQHVERVQAGAS
jgi:hypothetical protein